MPVCDFLLVFHCNYAVSQKVATYWIYGGKYYMDFIGNLLVFLAMKEFWKSVKNWQSYCDEFGALLLHTSDCLPAPAPAGGGRGGGAGGLAPVGNSAPQPGSIRNDDDHRTMVLYTLPAVEPIIRVNDSAIIIVAHILIYSPFPNLVTESMLDSWTTSVVYGHQWYGGASSLVLWT